MLSRGLPKRQIKARFLVPYGIGVAVSSYVKPGTVHRLSSRLNEYDNLMLLAHAVSAIVDEILEFGEAVSRGRKALEELPAAAFANTVRSLVGPYTYGNVSILPALFFTSMADALGFALRGDVGDPQDFYRAVRGEQVAELASFVRHFEKGFLDLSLERLTSRVRTGDVSLLDFFQELSAAGRTSYGYVAKPPHPQCVRAVEQSFFAGYNINVSVVNGYLELMRDDTRVMKESAIVDKLEHAIRLGGMRDKEGTRLLVELDRLMYSRGLLLDDLLVPLLRCVDKVLLR